MSKSVGWLSFLQRASSEGGGEGWMYIIQYCIEIGVVVAVVSISRNSVIY